MCGKFSRRGVLFGGLAGLVAAALPACGSGGSSGTGTTPSSSSKEWNATRYEDPAAPQMRVYYNGSDNGPARHVYFQHSITGSTDMPYVLLFDSSGKIWMKHLNADSLLGPNLNLGPVYWRTDAIGDSYQGSPVIDKMEITGDMYSGPLDVKLTGKIGDQATPDFTVEWLLKLYQPQLNSNKMYIDVAQTATCARNLTLSAAKQAEYRNLMHAVLRSMYVDSDTHNSNCSRFFVGTTITNKNFSDMLASGQLFDGLTASDKTGEMTHTDDNPNTPNLRTILLSPSIPAEFQWQGAYILDSNPENYNVAAGFNHKTAPLAWVVGDKATAKYRVIAADSPLDPSTPDADPN
jgi:hypothetical protein